MNQKEIFEAIKETKTWHDCTEKNMRLRALYSMASRRMCQVEFKPDVWIDTDGLHLPKAISFWHWLGGHDWLNYDDNNVFDGTRRICLICGVTESSPLKREYGYERNGFYDLDLAILLDFIREYLRGKI